MVLGNTTLHQADGINTTCITKMSFLQLLSNSQSQVLRTSLTCSCTCPRTFVCYSDLCQNRRSLAVLISITKCHSLSNLNFNRLVTESACGRIRECIVLLRHKVSSDTEGNLDTLKTFPIERRHQHHRSQLLLNESLQHVDCCDVFINLLSQFLHLLLSLLNSLSTSESLQGILNGSNLIVDISQLLNVSLGQTQRLELTVNL